MVKKEKGVRNNQLTMEKEKGEKQNLNGMNHYSTEINKQEIEKIKEN